MANRVLQGVFVHPPLAVARLGASPVPLDAFHWEAAVDPHLRGETVIAPSWTLDVAVDGSVTPRMPTEIIFRDGNAVRPTAPFFEIWALLGRAKSEPSTWDPAPLTPALLKSLGLTLRDVHLEIEAVNGKAARRTGKPDLAFGTWPPPLVSAASHARVALVGTSPKGAKRPMIPHKMGIPLGQVQFMKSQERPARGCPWPASANVEVIRFRLTPPAGLVYGPPSATKRRSSGNDYPAVAPAQAFLDERAGWAEAVDNTGVVQPQDTYDARTDGGASLGVVDDTSEVRFTVRVRHRGRVHEARANAFVAPPDFAPDRRPFLSLADELLDRCRKPGAATQPGDDAWVLDLFERVYETVSLSNVDAHRAERAVALLKAEQRRTRIAKDGVPDAHLAFGGYDALRDPLVPLPMPGGTVQLPIAERARVRHRELADINTLRDFARDNPGRLESLVRKSFQVTGRESLDASTMQMPPFMRQSNALPLTLAPWQYEALFAWVERAVREVRPTARTAAAEPEPLTDHARTRREQVLARLERSGR
jgi:hypothetical protein